MLSDEVKYQNSVQQRIDMPQGSASSQTDLMSMIQMFIIVIHINTVNENSLNFYIEDITDWL